MEQREKLIEIVRQIWHNDVCSIEEEVDHLLANDVVVLPCLCCKCEYQQECKNAQYFGLDGFCSLGKRKGGDK